MKSIKENQSGAIAILTIIGVTVFSLTIMISLSALGIDELRMVSAELDSQQTFYAAEAGINEALHRLISHPVPQPFSLTIDEYTIEVTVAANPADPYQRIIQSQATDSTGKVRTIQIVADTSAFSTGFDYAVQAGHGGIELKNNSRIQGDIYSNGRT